MHTLFARLGLTGLTSGAHDGTAFLETTGAPLVSLDPATGSANATLRAATSDTYERVLFAAQLRYREWRLRPAPVRAQLVRRLGELLREHKDALGELISLEVGKIGSEGRGEVQEMIDVCEFAVGLSRQLHGLTIASERPEHRMLEQWHPIGPVAIVTAFNFPMAVWAWNAALAALSGDPCVWKPSPRAPLCALAVQRLAEQAMREEDALGVFSLVLGDRELSLAMAEDGRFPLVSFTGSVAAGRDVAQKVAARLGRTLLELGGNNAVIVLGDANLELATRAIVFGAVGTAGQRCTSTRRVFVERSIAPELTKRLVAAYRSVRIGDPRVADTLMGPLISAQAVSRYSAALDTARSLGGELLCGGRVLERAGFFVEPTIVRAPKQAEFPIAWEETFAPILYLFEVDSLEEAINANNAVTQGLSSALFTDSVRAAERFLGPAGSDCGIANVNLGTSGAEIGGAFGGEKDTGGGRESGSDAWKAYMRRQTCTINGGRSLPLAQGVSFDV